MIGFIAGSFDVLHPGYIQMFKIAKNNCDALYVGLQEDPTIDRPSKLKPILSFSDRYEMLNSIKYIDRIYHYNTEADLVELLKEINPTIRFLGKDYIGKPITGEDLEIRIIYIDRSHGWSSTKFKNAIYEQWKSNLQ